MRKLSISISPAMFVLLLSMIATIPLSKLLACFIAAAIHEAGHILAARILHINLTHMRLDVLGARLHTTGRLCSYSAMVGLCFAGPFINFACFTFLLPFCRQTHFLKEICFASLSFGVLNLIPIQGFDGGRMVQAALCHFFSESSAEKICSVFSFLSLFFMWMLSVWMLLKTGTTLTLFVFSCYLFGMLFV